MAELVFLKNGSSQKVSDKSPLPVEITGNINIGSVTVDNTDVVNAINNLRSIVEVLETDIDAGTTPTSPDLKTRVSQVVTAVNAVQTAVSSLIAETQAIKVLIDNPSDTNDVFGRLDSVVSSLGTVVSRLESVRDLIDGPSSNDVRGDLATVITKLNDVYLGVLGVKSTLQDIFSMVQDIRTISDNINQGVQELLAPVYTGNFTVSFSGSSSVVSVVLSGIGPYSSFQYVSLRVVAYDSATNGANQIRCRLYGRYVTSPVDSRTEVLLAESSFASVSVLDYAFTMPFIAYRLEFERANTSYNNYRYQLYAVRR